MFELGQDLRFGARLLRRNPAFAAMAVLSLALGIGANTAIFSIFNGLFLGSLPYPDAERLVFLSEAAPTRNLKDTKLAAADFDTWRDHEATFERMAYFYVGGWSLAGFGDSVRVRGVWASYDVGPTLGIQPILGRYFDPRECQGKGARVAIISYRIWQRLFAGSRDALGKTIHLDGDPFEVIGVYPPTAVYPDDVDAWFPFDETLARTGYWLDGIGRLKPGVSIEQARADLLRLHRNAVSIRPSNSFTEPRVTPLRERHLGSYRRLTETLLAAVGLILMIACVNVAGLILARGLARSREAAIRAALGASRRRLMRQLLIETLLVTLVGGGVGVALGWAALQAMLPLMPDAVPSWVTFRLDARFAWFATVLTGLAGMLSGLWPALEFSKTDLRSAMAESSGRTSLSATRRRALHALVAGEVALALMLLSAGGLVGKALLRVTRADPGVGVNRNSLIFAVNPPYLNDQPRRRYYRGIYEALAGIPGVESVAQTNMPPLTDTGPERASFQFRDEEAPDRPVEQQPRVAQRIVMPGYLRAMSIPLVAGRDFEERDREPAGLRPVIVNRAFARLFWPPETNPVGKRISPLGYQGWMQVVGVAGDVRYSGLDRDPEPWFYVCETFALNTQSPIHMYYVTTGRIERQALTELARQAVRRMDPSLAMYDVSTVEEVLGRSLGTRRAYSWLFGVAAAVALLLALAGVYGVVSYVVTQRTREIGIRMALGADPRRVAREVVRGAMMLAAAGVAIGLAGAWFATRAMTSLLAGVSAHDPWMYAGAAAVLTAAVMLAAFVPARRAAAVDPLAALRQE